LLRQTRLTTSPSISSSNFSSAVHSCRSARAAPRASSVERRRAAARARARIRYRVCVPAGAPRRASPQATRAPRPAFPQPTDAETRRSARAPPGAENAAE
jgi:hypothetical protein